jgi:hypothetical protein
MVIEIGKERRFIVDAGVDAAALALQLPFSKMSALRGGLVGPAPE